MVVAVIMVIILVVGLKLLGVELDGRLISRLIEFFITIFVLDVLVALL